MKRGAWAILVLLLGACAAPATRVPDEPADARSRTAEVLSRDQWSLRGRIGVSNGEDGGSARIRWHAEGPAYELWIFAPLGQGTWRLRGNAERAELSGPQGTYIGPDANTLLIRHLGWHLPVQALTYWVRGLPAPGQPADVAYGARGRPAVIEQAGWRVEITEWADYPAFDMPRRIEAEQGPYQVRLVVQDWALTRAEG